MKRIAVFFTMLAALLLAGPQPEAAAKAPKATATFAIFIDNASYAACKAEVDAYRDQLVSEGLNALVFAADWTSPEQVKVRITALAKKKPALEGMVFIGDIPVVRVRQGQHMTTAFKMNENTFPMIESSVTSDRFYDDPALDFEFIGRDSLGHFYYNLTEKGAQHVQPAWYSGRILVPTDYPGDHADVLRRYLKKVVAAHKQTQDEGNPLDHFLFFAGHGYNSDCLTVWRQQPLLFREYFPAAFKQSSGNHFYNFRQDPYMKFKLFSELQRPGTDVFMFSEHGAPDTQYINGSYPARGLQANIVELKRSLRNYYKRLQTRRGQEKADEFAAEACAEYHLDRSMFSPEAIAAEAEGDSIAKADVNISLKDLEKIHTNARLVILNACYNGSFHEPGYVAGYHIFGEGDCIAAQGNTVNVLQDKWADQLLGLLSLGERLGKWQQEFCW
ncbi:MAG: HEAT repeat domain-containing protein, partial [Bacteroidales bacterium]|nr:HEAT repeat domain-containing protein [Bacteroidales bacterium]